MILPLPRTGPSRRCRLQFTTKIRLSSRSREARVIEPSDSGSSISPSPRNAQTLPPVDCLRPRFSRYLMKRAWRSEEHTSELQSLRHLVCRLLLEKKKKTKQPMQQPTRHLAISSIHGILCAV